MGSRRHKPRLKMSPAQNLISTMKTTSLSAVFLFLALCHIAYTQDDSGSESSSTPTPFIPSDQIQRSFSHSNPANCTVIFRDGKNTALCTGYTTIPTDVNDASEIKALDMSGGNSIQTLTEGQLAAANLPYLQDLILQNCRIRTIERHAFKSEMQLLTLDLSHNYIDVLYPEVFAEITFTNLKILRLHNNPIHRIKNPFPNLGGLTILNLNDCELNSFPVTTLDNLPGLTNIYMNRNNLTQLSSRVFKNTTKIKKIEISENPFHCDCEVKFLIDFISFSKIGQTLQQTSCTTSPSNEKTLVGFKWSDLPLEQLQCPPQIQLFKYFNYDVVPSTKTDVASHASDNNDNIVKLGQDVHFVCEYSGYPQPDIQWVKDKKPIALNRHVSLGDSAAVSSEKKTFPDGNGNGMVHDNDDGRSDSQEHKPKYELQNGTYNILRNMDDEQKRKNYKFENSLFVRRVDASDKGNYECVVSDRQGDRASKTLFLNVTANFVDDLAVGGVVGGGQKRVAVWIWILVGVICILIMLLVLLLVVFIWKRRDRQKQEGFRKVMHDKFKDSNVDLGELIDMKTNVNGVTQTQQVKDTYHPEGTTPLLEKRNESPVLVAEKSKLPDVALGNAQLLRNSQIFSPKPPPAHTGHPLDARREFFARQISEPYLRPASAMSLTRPGALNASQRRYVFANHPHFQSEPNPGMGNVEPVYDVPDHFRHLPRSGSSMSMSTLPEHDLRRQMFLRQYSQPSYATASRLPQRRNPSVSSDSSRDMMMGAYNYSTLPRRPIKPYNWSRPVSPTNSTCSTYSTLSWRPMPHPATGVFSDGVGARRGADGGSSLSLNKISDVSGSVAGSDTSSGLDSMNRAMTMTPTTASGKIKGTARNPRMGNMRTPNSLTRGYNDFFSFEPIQEVESSDHASTYNLDNVGGGRQTPVGTQSLARGEPRYKKKKPPPITVIPAHLKQPSGAFDHLKGRSVSPSLKQSQTGNLNGTKDNVHQNQNSNNDSNGNPVTWQESTIDMDEVINNVNQALQSIASPDTVSKVPIKPPPPPPKPVRNPPTEDESTRNDNQKITSTENPLETTDGTEV